MIKKIFFALTVVLFATSAVAQTGASCEEAIPVDKNYTAYVEVDPSVGYKVLWYTASTYDLPLNVRFIPDADASEWSPHLEIDLTCTPGVYEDSKIDSIIGLAEGLNFTFPIEMDCDESSMEGSNKVVYDKFVDDMYREQLAEFGVTYNVPAFIKVIFYESGTVTLKPDTLFSSCMENAEPVVLNDSISIIPSDSDRVFMMPFTDWQDDSIQFVWTGAEPAYIYMAKSKCDFEPELSYINSYVWACYTVQPGVPYRLSNERINDAILTHKEGGLFYSKILSASKGKLVAEIIPLQEAQGGATLLEYGISVELVANDASALYCFPKEEWKATEFITTSSKPIAIYTSNTADFIADSDDANLIAQYDFYLVGNQYQLSLSSNEMKDITDKATDEYIYVRFLSQEPTTITAYKWNASDCADKSKMIRSGNLMTIKARSSGTIYRLRYEDWRGYDITFDWKGGSRLPVFIADTCSFTLSSKNERLVHYKSITKQSSYVILAADVDSWADRVDPDGFLYVRFNPTAKGDLIITSARPELEPEPESPCVAASIELKAGDQITLNLDSAFTIYRIKYDEWVAQGARLQWSGETSLHTFLAETCQFAVAPYNRYVVNYVEIPVSGEFLLDATTLAEYATKVDAEGYLYIRFLTEKEGTLSVTSY